MARTKAKKIPAEESKTQLKAYTSKNNGSAGRLRKRLFHEFSACLAEEYQTCSSTQHDALSLLKRVDETKVQEPTAKKAEKDGRYAFLDPLERGYGAMPQKAGNSATSRYPPKSRTPMRP